MLEFDFKLVELYEMTVRELQRTLENRMSGLSYRLWKQANLISTAFTKNFPKTPLKASPELDYKPNRVTIEMPDFLKKEWVEGLGGKLNEQ